MTLIVGVLRHDVFRILQTALSYMYVYFAAMVRLNL